LFCLGLSLFERKVDGNKGEVIWLSTLKVVVSPIITLALVTYVFAMDELWSKAAVILTAMPSGVNAFVIAQQYNVHAQTVSSVVVVSTGVSVVTISLSLIWLGFV
jgi:predicted permease